MPEIVTIAEAAKRLAIKPQTIRKWQERKLIATRQAVTMALGVDLDELTKFLATREVSA